MVWYVIKRIFAAVGTLLVVMIITFILMHSIPGSPFAGEKKTQDQIKAQEEAAGLNRPWTEQFIDLLDGYLHGDMGKTMVKQEGTDVTKILFEQDKFTISIKLGISGVLLAVIIGVPLGCIAAYRRGTWIDGLLRVMTTVGVAIPSFVLATLLLYILSVQWELLPGKSGQLPDFKSYIMPVISMSFYYVCYVAKLTRTSMLDAINQDYIRTARAKGVKTGKLVLKHALRNSLIPVITYLGPVTAGIITGSFVVESTFQIPGLGSYFINCILSRDYNLIMGTTVLLSGLVIAMNLVVDLVYRIVDPRITLTAKED